MVRNQLTKKTLILVTAPTPLNISSDVIYRFGILVYLYPPEWPPLEYFLTLTGPLEGGWSFWGVGGGTQKGQLSFQQKYQQQNISSLRPRLKNFQPQKARDISTENFRKSRKYSEMLSQTWSWHRLRTTLLPYSWNLQGHGQMSPRFLALDAPTPSCAHASALPRCSTPSTHSFVVPRWIINFFEQGFWWLLKNVQISPLDKTKVWGFYAKVVFFWFVLSCILSFSIPQLLWRIISQI